MSLKDRLVRAPAWAYAVALFIAGIALGLGSDALKAVDNPVLEGSVTALIVVLVLGGSAAYWRRLDEAAREAHKFAWYWGGSCGLGLAIVAFAVLMGPEGFPIDAGFGGGKEPENFIAVGILGTILAQIAGYSVAWFGWWIAKR
ncbi:hypothetical protein [Phenylobacterium sp.]|uniref:hypothetical protein n=1 Tax=Phenylobacterium sp. TaxID=1871053 RepID=UPI00286B78C3|nr:hypothetical protein [Phenylobacterium sp.]